MVPVVALLTAGGTGDSIRDGRWAYTAKGSPGDDHVQALAVDEHHGEVHLHPELRFHVSAQR